MKNSKKWLLPSGLVIVAVLAGVFYMKNTVSQAETIPRGSIKSQLELMYNGEVDELQLDDDKYEATLTRAGAVYALEIEGGTGKVLSMELVSAAPELAADGKDSVSNDADGKDTAEADKPAGTPAVETPVQQPQKKPETQPSNGSSSAAQPEKQQPAKTSPQTPAPQPQIDPQPARPSKQPEAPAKTVLLTEQQAVQIALRQLNGEVDDVDFVKTTDGGYYLVEIEIDVDDGPDEATYQIHAISGKIMSVTWDD